MSNGDFLWCDLSALNAEDAKMFYGQLLGWTFEEIVQRDDARYHIASTGTGECAAIFEMPERFKKMDLPSFWMSYIQTDDIDDAIDRARRLGGKVEFGPEPFGDNALIALIRDPLGAGFTLYQGDELQPRRTIAESGHMTWNALYVSDAQAVTGFYEALFGWQISPDPAATGSYAVSNENGEKISEIHEQSAELRGGYEYWGVDFAVGNLAWAKSRLVELGGKVLAEETTDSGTRIAAQDGSAAAFYLVGSDAGEISKSNLSSSNKSPFKWRTALALLIVWFAVVTGINWVWGALFIMWTIPALRTGQTFLVEPIRRSVDPAHYWLIVGTWIGLSLFLIVYDLAQFFQFNA